MNVFMYGSETMIWKEMENLRGLLGTRRMDKVPNPQIQKLCRVKKRVDDRIDEGDLQWFGHEDRMENDRIS